ncbi:putative lipoprotein [Prevotella sp. MSX73]|nr:putative lipoprotein [Prevotella sp. MSX73]
MHLRTRHTANSSPFTGPCLMSACRAYSEQVGVKRQEGGVRGEMAS